MSASFPGRVWSWLPWGLLAVIVRSGIVSFHRECDHLYVFGAWMCQRSQWVCCQDRGLGERMWLVDFKVKQWLVFVRIV